MMLIFFQLKFVVENWINYHEIKSFKLYTSQTELCSSQCQYKNVNLSYYFAPILT